MLRLEFEGKKMFTSMTMDDFERKLRKFINIDHGYRMGEEHLASGNRIFHIFFDNGDQFTMKVFVIEDMSFDSIIDEILSNG